MPTQQYMSKTTCCAVTNEIYGGVSLREARFSEDLLQGPTASQETIRVSVRLAAAQRSGVCTQDPKQSENEIVAGAVP